MLVNHHFFQTRSILVSFPWKTAMAVSVFQVQGKLEEAFEMASERREAGLGSPDVMSVELIVIIYVYIYIYSYDNIVEWIIISYLE